MNIIRPEILSAEPPSRWPEAPRNMSVTAIMEIEACPRRWALRRADYPELWDRHGYPPNVHTGALLGSVVHLALEAIVRELVKSRCPSVKDPSAVSVMQGLGGYSRVVDDCIDTVISRLRVNPRAQRRLASLTGFLRERVPNLRTRVQLMLSRIRLGKGRSQRYTQSSAYSVPPATGTYSELEVSAEKIGWKGKLDLVAISPEACEITDFKTGAPSEAHRFQIEVYALLWSLDERRNPQGRPADRLILAYDNGELEVAVPSSDRRTELEQELVERGAAARASVSQRPPEARPDPAHCRSCEVRQLCDEYWVSQAIQANRYDAPRDTRFGDCEVTITARHGPSSWDARIERPTVQGGLQAVVRTTSQRLDVGQRVRLLDGATLVDEEDPKQPWVITLGTTSEVFAVSPPAEDK